MLRTSRRRREGPWPQVTGISPAPRCGPGGGAAQRLPAGAWAFIRMHVSAGYSALGGLFLNALVCVWQDEIAEWPGMGSVQRHGSLGMGEQENSLFHKKRNFVHCSDGRCMVRLWMQE